MTTNTQKESRRIKAKQHRKDDDKIRRDKDLRGAPHSFIYFEQVAIELCRGFNKKINVLDAGCGTGRYFCTFRNVNLLVGLDIDEFKLYEAKDPLDKYKVDNHTIKRSLVLGSMKDSTFKNESFDLIWSIGVIMKRWDRLGDQGLLNWISWLKPGGIMYFIWEPKESLAALEKKFSLLIDGTGLKYELSLVNAPIRKNRTIPYFTVFQGIKEE